MTQNPNIYAATAAAVASIAAIFLSLFAFLRRDTPQLKGRKEQKDLKFVKTREDAYFATMDQLDGKGLDIVASHFDLFFGGKMVLLNLLRIRERDLKFAKPNKNNETSVYSEEMGKITLAYAWAFMNVSNRGQDALNAMAPTLGQISRLKPDLFKRSAFWIDAERHFPRPGIVNSWINMANDKLKLPKARGTTNTLGVKASVNNASRLYFGFVEEAEGSVLTDVNEMINDFFEADVMLLQKLGIRQNTAQNTVFLTLSGDDESAVVLGRVFLAIAWAIANVPVKGESAPQLMASTFLRISKMDDAIFKTPEFWNSVKTAFPTVYTVNMWISEKRPVSRYVTVKPNRPEREFATWVHALSGMPLEAFPDALEEAIHIKLPQDSQVTQNAENVMSFIRKLVDTAPYPNVLIVAPVDIDKNTRGAETFAVLYMILAYLSSTGENALRAPAFGAFVSKMLAKRKTLNSERFWKSVRSEFPSAYLSFV